jgi:S1-C subfamily serine protease
MKVGDRVVTIDGAPVQGLLPAGAMTLVGDHKPGTTVSVGIDRGGTPVTLELPVTASPDGRGLAAKLAACAACPL